MERATELPAADRRGQAGPTTIAIDNTTCRALTHTIKLRKRQLARSAGRRGRGQ